MAFFDSLVNKFQTVSIEEVGVSLAGEVLKLNNANDAKVVSEKIRGAEKVEFLNMEGNSLGVEAAEEISRALETRKEFKKAYWKDMFTGRLKNEIPKALKHLGAAVMKAGAELEVLDLSDNASGPIGVEGFEDLLRSPSCYTLKELRLNNMGLGITGARKLAKALQDLVSNSKNAGKPLMLKVFVAGRNRLENEGATALARVFEKIGSLETVMIPQNGIYHPGITALCEAFKQNPNLRELNLNDNTITVKGATALAEVLPKLTGLKILDLGDCLLRNQGGLYVAAALQNLNQLETVDLSSNEMKSSAGLNIINALQSSQNLTSVNLSGNQFGPDYVDIFKAKADESKIPLTLSDDEGDDEEEEEDDDEYTEDGEEEEEEGEEEEEEEHDDDDDYNEEVDEILSGSESGTDDERNVSGISPLRPNMFLVDCTVNNFALLRDPVPEIVLGLKQKVSSDSLVEEMMSFIVKVSGLTGNEAENARLESCAIGLYRELSQWAVISNSINVVSNRLPVHLGYIKDEATNKKKVVPNRPRCLQILHKAMSSGFIPESSSSVIKCLEAQTDLVSNGI